MIVIEQLMQQVRRADTLCTRNGASAGRSHASGPDPGLAACDLLDGVPDTAAVQPRNGHLPRQLRLPTDPDRGGVLA